jgi:hypothetical protein
MRHDLFLLFRPSDPDPNTVYDTVDIYNATTGEWNRRSLSIARQQLAAASLPDLGLAFFAGGRDASSGVNFFLSKFHASFSTRASRLPFMLSFVSCTGGLAYDRIDMFNALTNTWSVSSLSQARIYLAGASLPEQGLVLFAGGSGNINNAHHRPIYPQFMLCRPHSDKCIIFQRRHVRRSLWDLEQRVQAQRGAHPALWNIFDQAGNCNFCGRGRCFSIKNLKKALKFFM